MPPDNQKNLHEYIFAGYKLKQQFLIVAALSNMAH